MSKLIGMETDDDAEKALEQKSDRVSARLVIFVIGCGLFCVCLVLVMLFIIYLHIYRFGGR